MSRPPPLLPGFVLSAFIACATAASLDAQPVVEPAQILMLFTHDPNAPGVAAFSAQLRSVVNAGAAAPPIYYDELLDLDRFPEPGRRPELARYVASKYAGSHLDAIVAEGAPALGFAMEHLTAAFPGVPIVYGNAFEPVVDFSALPANVTGTRLPLPFAGTLALARRLHPEAERVILVGGSAPLDSLHLSVAVEQITPLLGDLELVILQDWTYPSLLESLRALPPRTFVLFSSIRRDTRNVSFNTGDLIASLTSVSSAPVYGIARNWVGSGVVGGAVMDFGGSGARTGDLLTQVLRLAPGDPLPPLEVEPTPLVVDLRQLERWGLSEADLPAGTEVLFRAPDPWQSYRAPALGVLGLLAAQSLLIGLLLLERSRRRQAQHALLEQSAYEHMMAALTTDTVRHAPDDVAHPLQEALEQVGRFAGARAADLVVNEGAPGGRSVLRSWWADPASAERPNSFEKAAGGDGVLELPLVVEGRRYGTLRLYRPPEQGWPALLESRLEAGADVLAAALARAYVKRALEQTSMQLAHIARVATAGELVAAISHEIRQPLTAITANAQAGARLLALPSAEVEEARRIFHDISRDGLHAAEIMDHIRVLLRRKEPERTPIDLNEVCRDSARLLGPEARLRGVRLDLALANPLPPVAGDPVQLQQVVMNLVLNALDAAAESQGDRGVTISTLSGSDGVTVLVDDSGPGLKADPHQIFEPFFSTKAHGLGMGLTLVRTIVDHHGGLVIAANQAGGGACLKVWLPVDPPPDPVSHRPSSRREGDGGGAKGVRHSSVNTPRESPEGPDADTRAGAPPVHGSAP